MDGCEGVVVVRGGVDEIGTWKISVDFFLLEGARVRHPY